MKKVAVATVRGGGADQVSPVFGRCQTFTLIKVEDGEVKGEEVINNEFASAERGAGIQAVGLVARKKAEAIIAGSFGPNVFSICGQSDIKPFVASGMTASEAAKAYEKGDLEPVSEAEAGGPAQIPPPGIGGVQPGGGAGRGRGGRGFGGGRGVGQRGQF